MTKGTNPWMAALWALAVTLATIGLVLLGSSGGIHQYILGGVLLAGGICSLVGALAVHAIGHANATESTRPSAESSSTEQSPAAE